MILGLTINHHVAGSQAGLIVSESVIYRMDVKLGVPSDSKSSWTLNIPQYFAKSKWSITGTLVNFQFPTTFCRTSGIGKSVREWLGQKAFLSQPHNNLGILGGVKEVIVER